MTFCLDSQCIIWALMREDSQAPARVAQGTAFLAWADTGGHRIVVPSVAVHEALVKAQPAERLAWLAQFQQRLEIISYDARRAVLGAALDQAVTRPPGANRYKLKVDIMIAASAIGAGADAVISYDPDLRRICAGRLAVRG
ncbi:MAG: PIN domain-containing protein [Fimbriimonadaceae bacterium]|nr:PIN domain-containing protein [Fimbriimonadaceae bacterium]